MGIAINEPERLRAPGEGGPTVERGRLIDLNTRQADLHNVFRFLADVGGVSIVVGQGISGRVTVRLRRVSWRRALEVICQSHGLRTTEVGNILLIEMSAHSQAR